ncbi:AAA family ATPase [Microaerobacter geothermalis]|uniref:ExeA family protein n=1 Tax=Microaerobacter geothermalis TaxID=674972 RepID=UPI001F3B5799|nr:AAA family ATPase [Microaerobacter geothermalis]MCF6094015.1 AAA family ATPase [Microaerobacter geothermalis]
MYKSFYSLTRTPFGKEIKEMDAFASTAFKEATAALNYLKNTRGMGVLVGEPGVGKTFALRSFAKSLNPSLYKVMYFPLSTGSVIDFYRGLAYELGEEPKYRKVDLFRQIQLAVQRFYSERKITPVFILDEMQMAKDQFLHDVSILFNFYMDSKNPFVLVFTGLPHLLHRLALNQNRPLAQRIIMRYKLEALTREEVAGYVQHHMEMAGAHHAIFTEDGIEAMASRSRGWPRLINNLATHALMYGCQLKKEQIDSEVVRMAAEELAM